MLNTNIPTPLQEAIESLTLDIGREFEDTIVSIVLYDGMVKNKDIRENDAVKIMFVFRSIDIALLDRLAAVFKRFERPNQLKPLILTKEDLKGSADVFPIKFLDIQQDYQVLAGKDVVKELSIRRDHLLLRCEQEIKNLMLRLRSSYIKALDQKNALSRIMLRTYYTLLRALDVMAELKNGQTYRQPDEILRAASRLGLDVSALQRIQTLRSGKEFANMEEERETFNSMMQLINKAALMADKMV